MFANSPIRIGAIAGSGRQRPFERVNKGSGDVPGVLAKIFPVMRFDRSQQFGAGLDVQRFSFVEFPHLVHEFLWNRAGEHE